MSFSKQGTPNRTTTVTILQVHLPVGNRLKLDAGYYPLAIGGWKVPTDRRETSDKNIGLNVKCSGYNPTPGAQQKPDDHEYALGREGQVIPVIAFPVNHKNFWKGIEPLARGIKKCWREGKTVLFFDDGGDGRAISGVCYFLSRVTGVSGKVWLPTLIVPNRQIADVFYELLHQSDVLG